MQQRRMRRAAAVTAATLVVVTVLMLSGVATAQEPGSPAPSESESNSARWEFPPEWKFPRPPESKSPDPSESESASSDPSESESESGSPDPSESESESSGPSEPQSPAPSPSPSPSPSPVTQLPVFRPLGRVLRPVVPEHSGSPQLRVKGMDYSSSSTLPTEEVPTPEVSLPSQGPALGVERKSGPGQSHTQPMVIVPSTSKAGRTSTWLPAALLAGILFGMAFIYSVTRRVQQLVAARVKPVNDRAPASADGLGRGLVTKPRLSGSSLTPPLAR